MIKAKPGEVGYICFRVSNSPRRVSLASINSSLDKPIDIPTVGPSEDGPRKPEVNHVAKTYAITVGCGSGHVNSIASQFFRIIKDIIKVSHYGPRKIMENRNRA